MDRSNNFRTNFVGRMVGDKAECSRFQIEEQILREDSDVDLAKLAHFAFKHNVPKIHRVPIWKLLLSSCLFKIFFMDEVLVLFQFSIIFGLCSSIFFIKHVF